MTAGGKYLRRDRAVYIQGRYKSSICMIWWNLPSLSASLSSHFFLSDIWLLPILGSIFVVVNDIIHTPDYSQLEILSSFTRLLPSSPPTFCVFTDSSECLTRPRRRRQRECTMKAAATPTTKSSSALEVLEACIPIQWPRSSCWVSSALCVRGCLTLWTALGQEASSIRPIPPTLTLLCTRHLRLLLSLLDLSTIPLALEWPFFLEARVTLCTLDLSCMSTRLFFFPDLNCPIDPALQTFTQKLVLSSSAQVLYLVFALVFCGPPRGPSWCRTPRSPRRVNSLESSGAFLTWEGSLALVSLSHRILAPPGITVR